MKHASIKPDKPWSLLGNTNIFLGNTYEIKRVKSWSGDEQMETGEVGKKVKHCYYYLHLDMQGTLGMTRWKGKKRSSSERLWTWLHSSVFCSGIGWTQQARKLLCLLYILLKFFQTPRSTDFMKRTAKLSLLFSQSNCVNSLWSKPTWGGHWFCFSPI